MTLPQILRPSTSVSLTALAFALAGCASAPDSRGQETNGEQFRYIAPDGMIAKLGPCEYLRDDDRESALATALIGKGVDLFFNALQAAGDPEKGRALNTASTSALIDSYDQCLFIADGSVAGRSISADTNDEAMANFRLMLIPERTRRIQSVQPNTAAQTVPAGTLPAENVAEGDSDEVVGDGPLDGMDAEPIPGSGSGSPPAVTALEEKEILVTRAPEGAINTQTERNYSTLFENAGVYFTSVPEFSGIFKIEYVDGKIRLLPYAMTYAQKSPGKLFRTSSRRSLILTFTLSDPGDAQKKASIGPFTLGRFAESPTALYDFGSLNVNTPNHSLRPTQWASLPENLKQSGDGDRIAANLDVTLVEIQSASRVAELAYEILKPEKEEITATVAEAILGKDKPSPEEEEAAALAAISDYLTTAVTPACTATQNFMNAANTGKVTPPIRGAAYVKQQEANAAFQAALLVEGVSKKLPKSLPFPEGAQISITDTVITGEYGQTFCGL